MQRIHARIASVIFCAVGADRIRVLSRLVRYLVLPQITMYLTNTSQA